MRAIAVALLLAAASGVQATESIDCQAPKGRPNLEIVLSLSGEGVGGGVIGLRLDGASDWTVIRARADHAQHRLDLRATRPQHQPLQLTVRRSRGELRIGSRHTRLVCDWSAFGN